jgi:hypothetical protein
LSETLKGVDPVKHVRNQMKEAIGVTAEAFEETFTLVDPDTPPVSTKYLFALYVPISSSTRTWKYFMWRLNLCLAV